MSSSTIYLLFDTKKKNEDMPIRRSDVAVGRMGSI